MAVRGVIFDFGGVLCFAPNDEQVAEAAAVSELPPEIFWDVFWLDRIDYDAGRLTPEQYWTKFAQRTGKPYLPARLPALVAAEKKLWSNYDPRILAWAGLLREQGIRTAMLSNLPRPLGEGLRSTPGFLDPFEHLTLSYELGIVKPQRGIYEHAVTGLRLAPEETVFIDDRQENIEGADAAGLRTELYTTWEDFLQNGAILRHGLPQPRVEPNSPLARLD